MAIQELFLSIDTGNDGSLDWQDRALCPQTDPEAFFPEKGGSTREAKKVCLECDVRDECLDYALGHDERFGIWGGLSERERRRFKKQRLQENPESQHDDSIKQAIADILTVAASEETDPSELIALFQESLPEWQKFAGTLVDSYIGTLVLKRRQQTPKRLTAFLFGQPLGSSVSKGLIKSERDRFKEYLSATPGIVELCLEKMSDEDA